LQSFSTFTDAMVKPPKYSVIVPVYNRPDEVRELLFSLTKQTYS